MILSGRKIADCINDGSIVISDFNESQLNPNSYNLCLHNEMLVYKDGIDLDMKSKMPTEKITIPEDGYLLKPGELYLGRTVEWTETEKYVPAIIGRSSVGRLGIFVHVTAGFGDVGFKGYWTLEITCIRPVRVYPGVQVCQIYYNDVTDDEIKYAENAKYQNQTEIRTSRLWTELD